MGTTYGADRSKIYKYLESKGLVVNEETHAALKSLLIEYVNHQNASLLEEAKAWRNHQPKCEMFKARAQSRRDKINKNPSIVKAFHTPTEAVKIPVKVQPK